MISGILVCLDFVGPKSTDTSLTNLSLHITSETTLKLDLIVPIVLYVLCSVIGEK